MLPKYEKCCCCFSVRTGAMILAILGLAWAGTSIVASSFEISLEPQFREFIDQAKEELMKEYQEAGAREDQKAEMEQMLSVLDAMKEAMPYVFVINLVGGCVSFLIYGLLMGGLVKSKAWMMLPWLISHLFSLILTTIGLAIAFIVLCVAAAGGFVSGLILLAITSPFLALQYYLWFVVRSVYLDTKDLDKRDTLPLFESDGYAEL